MKASCSALCTEICNFTPYVPADAGTLSVRLGVYLLGGRDMRSSERRRTGGVKASFLFHSP